MSEKCGGLESLALTTVNRAHDTTHTRTHITTATAAAAATTAARKTTVQGYSDKASMRFRRLRHAGPHPSSNPSLLFFLHKEGGHARQCKKDSVSLFSVCPVRKNWGRGVCVCGALPALVFAAAARGLGRALRRCRQWPPRASALASAAPVIVCSFWPFRSRLTGEGNGGGGKGQSPTSRGVAPYFRGDCVRPVGDVEITQYQHCGTDKRERDKGIFGLDAGTVTM